MTGGVCKSTSTSSCSLTAQMDGSLSSSQRTTESIGMAAVEGRSRDQGRSHRRSAARVTVG